MTIGIVYKRTAPNGKAYIGQTYDECNRNSCWGKALYYSGKHSLIDRARRKYGKDNFTYEVLKTFKHRDVNVVCRLLDIAEVNYIKIFATHYVLGRGYNMTLGGNHRHFYLCTEHKQRISTALKGKSPKNLGTIQQSEKTK